MKLLSERITGKPREQDYWEMYALMDEMYSKPKEPKTFEQVLYDITAQRLIAEMNWKDLPKTDNVWKEVKG